MTILPTQLLLAAGDWGDLIFLVVVLVGGLIQWISGLKRKQGPEDSTELDIPSPYGQGQDPSRREPVDPDPEPSWDELMDALGQRPGNAPPIPTPPPLFTPPPPPVPTPAPALRSEPEALSTPFRSLADQSPETPALSDHLKSLLASIDEPRRAIGQSDSSLSPSKKDHHVPTVTGATTTRFSRLLREPGQVRRAIVLQEILQPPLALR